MAEQLVSQDLSDVSSGLAQAIRALYGLRAELTTHEEASSRETKRLENLIAEQRTILERTRAGLDVAKIALAETIIYATTYANGGADRGSVVADAIKQIATGQPAREHYGDLRTRYFGTKNYDRWQGQRSDHEYGMGPSHGSICFRVGLQESARTRDLTEAERDAAVYYLLNLGEIQASRVPA